jgi:hypothetical protein
MNEGRLYIAEDETGHKTSFLGSVGDALVIAGFLFKVGDKWCIRRADVDVISEYMMDLAVCDFCSARPVTFDCDVTTFYNHRNMCVSNGGWTACEPCGLLIEARDEKGLLNRMVGHSLCGEMIREAFEYQQRLFWQNFKSVKRIAAKPATSPSITCPVCKMTSYNPNDIAQKYCGNCHKFHSDL